MRSIFILLMGILGLSVPIVTSAGENDPNDTLVVELLSGDYHYYQLSAQPKAKLNDAQLGIFDQTDELLCEYAFDEIAQFFFTHNVITDKLTDPKGRDFMFKYSDNCIELYGIAPSSEISLYDMSGNKRMSVRNGDETTISIDISSLSAGVYVVQIPSIKNIKIIKK
ncbi:MAG: T9SS type A sorting domain-containing protein [Bacteroidales bacterium]|nr:T9SS type A sorting domain-containing protein [Bacteroidales bacterium]